MSQEQIEAQPRQYCFDEDFSGIEPALRSSAVEHQLQRTKSHREEPKADPVELLGVAIFPIIETQPNSCRGQNSERHVDVEDPAPTVEIGQVAPERRTQNRPHHHDKTPDGHDRAALVGRIAVENDRLRQRRQRRSKRSLQQTKDNDFVERLGRPAHDGGDGKAKQRGDEEISLAEPRRKPPHRCRHDGCGDDVGSEDPGDLVARGLQTALHVGQCDICDRLIEHLHEGAQHGANDGDAQAERSFANGYVSLSSRRLHRRTAAYGRVTTPPRQEQWRSVRQKRWPCA